MSVQRLVDPRLYRIAFLPTLIAIVVAMFSLEGRPQPLEALVATATFESNRAAATTRQILAAAPTRPAGGPGDERAGDLVAERFREVRAGTVSEQHFDGSAEGEELDLRNVVLTLPGEQPSAILVIAARDSPEGAGATTSAAATGVLVELAGSLSVAGHERTFVLASTSGEGGAMALISSLAALNPVSAVVVIAQPGAAERRQPYVVSSSSGQESGSSQLERTAALAVETQIGEPSAEASWFTQLARLAIPSGIGLQAPLIDAGFDAVAISSAGERPLEPSRAELGDLTPANLSAFGRAVQATVGALDTAEGDLEHGPSSHVELSDNLIPGWTISVIGLALILPALIAAIDALARSARRSLGPLHGLGFAALWALPAVGALAALYGLALLGVIPRPEFPFDPARFPLGVRAAAATLVVLAAALASAVLLRRRGLALAGAPRSAAAGTGALGAVACLVIWAVNPYLGLLLAPAAHVWLLAEGGGRRRLLVPLVAVLALAPALAAILAVSEALELGADAPWTLALMVSGGQIPLASALSACFLLASVAAAAALAVTGSAGAAGNPAGSGVATGAARAQPRS